MAEKVRVNIKDKVDEAVHYLKTGCQIGKNGDKIIYAPTYSPNNIKHLYIFPTRVFVKLHKKLSEPNIVSVNFLDTYYTFLDDYGMTEKTDSKGNITRSKAKSVICPLSSLKTLNKAQNIEGIFIFTEVDKATLNNQLNMCKSPKDKQDLMNAVNFYHKDFTNYLMKFDGIDWQTEFDRLKFVVTIPMSYQDYQLDNDKKAYSTENIKELVSNKYGRFFYYNDADIQENIHQHSSYQMDADLAEFLKNQIVEKEQEEEQKVEEEKSDKEKSKYEKTLDEYKKYYRLLTRFGSILDKGYSLLAEDKIDLRGSNIVKEIYKTEGIPKNHPTKVAGDLSKDEQMKQNMAYMESFKTNSYLLVFTSFINNLTSMLNSGYKTGVKVALESCSRVLLTPTPVKSAVDSLCMAVDEKPFEGRKIEDSFFNLLAYYSQIFLLEKTDKEYWKNAFNGTSLSTKGVFPEKESPKGDLSTEGIF